MCGAPAAFHISLALSDRGGDLLYPTINAVTMLPMKMTRENRIATVSDEQDRVQ